jgi:hypothetical protein
MTTEQQLLETWRKLPQTKQQAVLDFAQFLVERRTAQPSSIKPTVQIPTLGERLQSIRDQIVESGMPLLTREEVDQEICDRRVGY